MKPGIHTMTAGDCHAIPLPARDGSVRAYALVDIEDFEALSAYHWSCDRNGYARRFEGPRKGRRCISMHRQILDLTLGDGLEGDHINGERLDNRRANLRVVTHAQNGQNIRRAPGRSGHRNVHWHAGLGLWRVRFNCAGVYISGGCFKRLEDAVAAAATLRRELMPFAVEVDA
ncbi:MAG: HNH endonuclease [Gemmatimonadaceae bacterium]|nr:HNH endonuclease [Gemmatimonadaceae bacterium]